MFEQDDIIFSILNNLIYLSQKNISYCNNSVKAGCPRLLLQIIETSLNEKNVECALELLKIISNSNEDNIKMISSQNALNVFFQAKKKYEGNNDIINICDDVSKDILKLPGQENYVKELISENINQFNIDSKNDFSDKEIRQHLLNSLQIINSFVSNETQINLINDNEEFLENFKDITEKTFKEKELDSLNEKLVNNELSLLKKINNENHKYFGYDYIIDKSLDIIKNKSKYQDILITSTNEFLKYLSIQTLYEKHISNKINTAFIDSIFDAMDNYLGNLQETKDLNNILFYLCLYSMEFATYIKQKGGLNNVYEELKNNINNNDESSNIMKLNSLKMIYSLCNNDQNEINSFIKSGGVDLLNKLIENETEKYKDYINSIDKDLYKVKELQNLLYEQINEDDISDNDNSESNNIIIYTFKLIVKIIDFDEKYFNNKIINDIVVLSEIYYPNRDIFDELSQLFLKDIKYLVLDEKYLFLFLKNVLSLKVKYYSDKKFIINKIDKLLELILPKIFESNNYFNDFSLSLNNNSLDPLQLYYLSEIIYFYEKIKPETKIQIFEDIVKFTADWIKYYKEKEINNNQEDITINIAIPLLNLVLYIIKNKKEDIQFITDNMNVFIFISKQILFKKEYKLFTYDFITKCNTIFDNLEQNEDKNKCYLEYLSKLIPESIEMLENINKNISNENKYHILDEIISSLFDLIIK